MPTANATPLILADASVWIRHASVPDDELLELLEAKRVVSHRFVESAVACSALPQPEPVLERLDALPHISLVTPEQLLAFLRRHELGEARDVSWVDVELLASTALAGAKLYSRNTSLATLAWRLELAE